MTWIFRTITSFSGGAALLATSTAIACMCLDMGQFQDYAQAHPVVVRATVEAYGERLRSTPGTYETMVVSVADVIKGKFEHESFEFIGDTGMSCLRYITEADFPIGSEHLFILESDAAIQSLLVCGESSVRVVGNNIEGITRGVPGSVTYTMPLSDLLSIISSPVSP